MIGRWVLAEGRDLGGTEAKCERQTSITRSDSHGAKIRWLDSWSWVRDSVGSSAAAAGSGDVGDGCLASHTRLINKCRRSQKHARRRDFVSRKKARALDVRYRWRFDLTWCRCRSRYLLSSMCSVVLCYLIDRGTCVKQKSADNAMRTAMHSC